MTKPRLDLTTSSINFSKSLIDFPLTGALVDAGQETYKWLIRERIDEGSFNACRDLAASLAYPNEEGMKLQAAIETADRQILQQLKRAPLKLVVSGSLGRLVGRNPETAYIVTTVSALTQYHDPEYATDALCSMILDKGGHEKEVSLKYDVQRAPIKAVISKIVDSVYVNVVNAGQTLPRLPEKLQSLHKHLLDDRTFAAIVMGIQKTEGNVVVRSKHFLADLTLWLYFHFEGKLEIVVQNKILLEERRGAIDRTVRLIVDKICPEGSTACWEKDGSVEASLASGKRFLTFLRGTDDNDFRPCSFERQPFCQLDNLIAGPRMTKIAVLNRAELNSITHAAKTVLKWILEISIAPAHKLVGLCFKVDLLATDKTQVIGGLLLHHPQLLHLSTGQLSTPGPVFRLQEDDGAEDEYLDRDFDWEDDDPTTPSKIVTWFPVLEDVIDSLRQRCSCYQCKIGSNLDDCKSGCLREAGMTRFFLLLAHAFSNAMGGIDASGRSNPEDQIKGMTYLFHEIIRDQIIRWDTLFEVVASTVAGVGWSAFETRGMDDGGSSWAAVQYGSFVAAASWLDLETKPDAVRPFALIVLEGNIQGVPDDFGLVRCEMLEFDKCNTSEIAEPMQLDDERPMAADWSLTRELDTVKVELFTAIFRSDSYLYRLMTTVRSGNHLRIIDPSMAIRGAFAATRPQCNHDDSEEIIVLNRQAQVHDFDYALANWSSQGFNDTVEMSKTLDSMVKLNTLLSISVDACVLREVDRCCLNCALQSFESVESRNFRQLITFNRNEPKLVISKRRTHEV
jgi:hypothetical protein